MGSLFEKDVGLGKFVFFFAKIICVTSGVAVGDLGAKIAATCSKLRLLSMIFRWFGNQQVKKNTENQQRNPIKLPINRLLEADMLSMQVSTSWNKQLRRWCPRL